MGPEGADGGLERTEDCVLRALDRAYAGRLSRIRARGDWRDAVRSVCPMGTGALPGEVNLHGHAPAVARIGAADGRPRAEVLSAGGRAP